MQLEEKQRQQFGDHHAAPPVVDGEVAGIDQVEHLKGRIHIADTREHPDKGKDQHCQESQVSEINISCSDATKLPVVHFIWYLM